MKKFIVISVVMALLIGALIWEVVFTDSFYRDVKADLQVVEQSIWQHKDNLDNEETAAAVERALNTWQKKVDVLLIVENHAVVRSLDDKIVGLHVITKSDNFNDAVIYVQSAINFINDVLTDDMPLWNNIL